jgi:uncharacterized protein YukE
MSEIQVTYSELMAAAARFDAGAYRCRGVCSALAAAAARTYPAVGAGPVAPAFEQMWKLASRKLEAQAGILEERARVLRVAAVAYRSSDETSMAGGAAHTPQ